MISAKSVDQYIEKSVLWKAELKLLRAIVLDCGLIEEVKWGGPIYTESGKNVVGLGSFKSYVGLWFHQGVFLTDPEEVLITASEGTTRGLRQWRFEATSEINPALVKQYIIEARENARAGKEIKPERKKLKMSEELHQALTTDSHFQMAFDNLSRGKQVEYAEFIGSAKQDATRISRLRKSIPMILDGKGLHDKYR